MEILLYRVDGRLLHGQVVVSCVRNYHPTEIVVANDEAAQDEFQRTLLEFAAPPNIRLYILKVEETAQYILEEKLDRAIVVVKNPQDMLRLIEKGVNINEVNIGGMYHEPNKKQYAKALFVDDSDILTMQKFKEKGVRMYYQMAFQDPKEDVWHLLKIRK